MLTGFNQWVLLGDKQYEFNTGQLALIGDVVFI